MFEAALPTVGFLPTARKVKAYNGKEWKETEHDLDRVFERDGIAYGAEIKNTLKYIPRHELTVKTKMCQHLGLLPLFIVRAAAKSYVNEVRLLGGFTLVFKYQLYPLGTSLSPTKCARRLDYQWTAQPELPTGRSNGF